MMDGIEVLAQEKVVVYTSTPVWPAIVFGFIVVLFALIGFFVVLKMDEDWLVFAAITGLGLIIATFVSSALFSAFSHTDTVNEYKVIISDNVNVAEFYEHYDVIEVEGKIFTIREKK